MAPTPPVALYASQSYFPQYFEPAPALLHRLGAQPEQFFMLRVEKMYRHVRGPVSAVRSAAHTALFITSGEARMAVGYDHYAARTDELLLLAEASHAYRPAPGPAPSAAATLSRAFLRLLSQRIRTEHRVAAYVDWLHATPNHLNKAVRNVTGQSPTRWIDEALVLETKALLFQNTRPVAEVAALVGVADASYFSRLIKKMTGQRPGELRPAAGAPLAGAD